MTTESGRKQDAKQEFGQIATGMTTSSTHPPTPDHEPPKRPSIKSRFLGQRRRSDQWIIALTSVIAIGGLISAAVFFYQLQEMKAQSELTRKSIELTQDSLRLGKDTFVAAQRPWLSIEMSILGPLIFDANGAEITIGVKVRNHGHSPAINARNFVILDPDPANQKGPHFCALQRSRTATNFSQIIFPDESTIDTYVARTDASEIRMATKRRNTITPFVTACINHTTEFDHIHHQTELTANLLRKTGH